MDNWLTVIIPFRNEGIEVHNTVKNIKESAGQELDIILINDGSDDEYDYLDVALRFHAEYLEHEKSVGVAASREHGIELCKTSHFLLLDAHMRAFTPNWATNLKVEIEKDQRAIYCCQTVALNQEGELISNDIKGAGVRIHLKDLSYEWYKISQSSDETVADIPCVMGASYASNKSYWKLLHGLKGLRSYGFDEQLISIKAFLEGGTCKLIKTITFGHIFREVKDVPYSINAIECIFNQLYLVEILYPWEAKRDFFRQLKEHYGNERVTLAVTELIKVKEEVHQEKSYYDTIFHRTFEELSIYSNEIPQTYPSLTSDKDIATKYLKTR
ncbi:MAG: glycosyltransferase [Mediterranea sp.]|jgi:glycosyltransferase involved in cell wall biosynthesis|nr:glycosyltransferase [Mediterranea sp.]